MTEPERSPSGLRIVAAIGREFERVGDARRAPRLRDRFSRRGSRALGVALAGGLLSVGVAGAATGVLPVGTVIQGGSDPENAHEHGPEEKTVIARGVSPVAGPWRLTSQTTDGNPETGEPPGDCLELLLTEPPQGTPIGGTLLCQNVGESRFKADSVPVVDTSSGESELILFGTAPEAVSVELSTDRGTRFRAKALGPGRPWVMAVPSGQTAGRLQSIAGNGAARANLDASTYFEQLSTWERVLTRKDD